MLSGSGQGDAHARCGGGRRLSIASRMELIIEPVTATKCQFTFKNDPILPPNNGPPCGTEGQLERSRSRTSPQDQPSHSFLCRYHPWLPFHRCPMRRSFYNQRGGKFRRNFPS